MLCLCHGGDGVRRRVPNGSSGGIFQAMTRILIVEDHALVREAMAQTLARLEPDTECVEVPGSEDALALLERNADWDLVMVDLMLPDLNGFSLLGVLAKRFPEIPTIVVSALDDASSLQ